jgi:hypothetical protein
LTTTKLITKGPAVKTAYTTVPQSAEKRATAVTTHRSRFEFEPWGLFGVLEGSGNLHINDIETAPALLMTRLLTYIPLMNQGYLLVGRALFANLAKNKLFKNLG